MKKKNHLLENILFYFLGFFFVSCFLLISYFVASSNIADSVRKSVNSKVESGLVRFDGFETRLTMMNTTIVQDYEFNNLVYAENGEGTFVNSLKSLNSLYRSLSIIADDVSYIFTVFPSKDTFLSSSDVSTGFASYYSRFMRLSYQGEEIEDADSFYRVLYEAVREDRKYLSFDYIVYMSSSGTVRMTNPMVMIQPSSTFTLNSAPQFISVFVVSAESVAETLLEDTLASVSYIRVTDLSGTNTIFDNVDDDADLSDYVLFETDGKAYSVSVFVPDSYMKGQSQYAVWILAGVISVGCLSCVVFALFYALRHYRGVNHILSVIEDGSEKGELKGDFADIKQRIITLRSQGETYREEANELERQNQAIRFQNILIRGMKSPGDYTLAGRVVSFYRSGYAVVIIRAVKGNFQWYEGRVDDSISKGIFRDAVSIHSGSSDEIFILPCSRDSRPQIEEALTGIFRSHSDTVLHAGISLRADDIEKLPELYEMAERVVTSLYMYEGESTKAFYEPKKGTSLLEVFNLESLSRLKNLVLSSQETLTEEILTSFFSEFEASPIEAEERKEEIYYGLYSVYQSAFLSLGIEDLEIEKYRKDMTMAQMKSIFTDLTHRLCEKTKKTKKSHNEELLASILAAIDSDFSNPGFSSYTLSTRTGMNEKYLNTFFKEQVGTSLFSYVQSKRATEAKRLLEETDYTNEQIASLTGFGSINTFYRNFNKYFGVTPKAYKEELSKKAKNGRK